ncbi:CCA tRNA nucleotidyltransferase [Staphylococcus simiae]|uniref:CCA tRNA nucleotidyltransferase n=1 Tax=Staphylococcus simiae TaxID=308354 RepID=UPI001A97AB1B|nr:CCA tRNA nucleotidyltransferase [Staphylococcus simiae]MBO1197863.1 CCA tRNA nucleotidyltransferase [Staphylococcus simiae]MBO1200054.1 CCA tRNA nucleotidyltransferase [Staphylococcus simiae]MBO1202327.1 CCA tRNA nucleotidyltransferase [Staphylococcus simiae]MBO1209854.1 CCA tRNA nucleotidyltransferase [Staphylococcus simiae]MBO1228471.1 CCA tRNA nucleotidyltransferase [Staphylococcus simiae]
MDTQLFEQAKPILTEITNQGYEAFFVGGSVRDHIMGRNIHDIDITTSATPDEIENIFSHTIPIGKEHGTINVVVDHNNYEITTFRAEEDYIDHRRPSNVTFVRDLYKDLQRRDFTMNAIAMDQHYQLYDYFNGQEDIKQRLIRTVGNANERFEEDALRMIRCLRFQSQLTFGIAPTTYKAMSQQMPDISYLSIERIITELTKLITGANVAVSFQNMIELRAFDYIPFFKNFKMDNIRITEPISLELFIAIVLAQQPQSDSLKQLKLSNLQIKTIQQYVKLIEMLPQISTKDQLKLVVYDYDVQLIKVVINSRDILTANELATAQPLIVNQQSVAEIERLLPIQQRQEMAVNGGTLMSHLTKSSGPWIKEVLRQIECAIITNKVENNEREILKWVDNHVKI